MKKAAAILLAILILAGAYAAVAAGGSSSDPLISKSYLDGTYIPGVVKQAEDRVDKLGESAYSSAAALLKTKAELYLARAGAVDGETGYADTFQEQRLKRGDVVTVDTGSGILLLAGEASLSFEAGTVIDVTRGSAAASGTALEADHRYLVGEETLCRVTVTSETAVLAPQGYYAVARSVEVDYNELADALKAMGVFKGSTTGFGSGYELERQPTRIQGLIMFLRLIGEEEAALAYPPLTPFSDVPDWCRSYVAYSADKGYVKGFGDGYFRPDSYITAKQYTTLLLRSLGYRDEGDAPDFTFDTVLARAQVLGVISQKEQALLNGPSFLRAHVVYFSYYALSAQQKGSGVTLLDRLAAAGVMDRTAVVGIMDSVVSKRLS